MKTICIPLVAVILLAAASTASAGWTYVVPTYRAPAVYYYGAHPSFYAPAPVVTIPRVVIPPRAIYPAPVVVRSTVVVPRRPTRRTMWTTWY